MSLFADVSSRYPTALVASMGSYVIRDLFQPDGLALIPSFTLGICWGVSIAIVSEFQEKPGEGSMMSFAGISGGVIGAYAGGHGWTPHTRAMISGNLLGYALTSGIADHLIRKAVTNDTQNLSWREKIISMVARTAFISSGGLAGIYICSLGKPII